MTRASSAISAGTWSFTPPVATRYIEGLPIRSPSRNVGMPSASSRIRAAAAASVWGNLVTVTQEMAGPASRWVKWRGSSAWRATSCLGQIAPTGSRRRDSQIGQYPLSWRIPPQRVQSGLPGSPPDSNPQVGQNRGPMLWDGGVSESIVASHPEGRGSRPLVDDEWAQTDDRIELTRSGFRRQLARGAVSTARTCLLLNA